MLLLAPEPTSQWSARGECDKNKDIATPANSWLAGVEVLVEAAAALHWCGFPALVQVQALGDELVEGFSMRACLGEVTRLKAAMAVM